MHLDVPFGHFFSATLSMSCCGAEAGQPELVVDFVPTLHDMSVVSGALFDGDGGAGAGSGSGSGAGAGAGSEGTTEGSIPPHKSCPGILF